MFFDTQGIPDRFVDPGKGEHLFIITVAYRLGDAAIKEIGEGRKPEPGYLDRENIMGPPQAGCYKCEQPLTRRLIHRKCTGEM